MRQLRLKEVAKMAEISPITFRRWIKLGWCPPYQKTPSGLYRFDEDDVRQWLDGMWVSPDGVGCNRSPSDTGNTVQKGPVTRLAETSHCDDSSCGGENSGIPTILSVNKTLAEEIEETRYE